MALTSREEYLSRDAILKLLSDDEIARVSAAAGSTALHDGADYLDLEHLDRGVQKASATTKSTMVHIIPKAVHMNTRAKIIAKLGH